MVRDSEFVGRDDYLALLEHYLTRDNLVAVDLVGADDIRHPSRAAFAGSIKWREGRNASFDRSDSGNLAAVTAAVPRADGSTLLVGVSRGGFDDGARLDVALGPEELLDALR